MLPAAMNQTVTRARDVPTGTVDAYNTPTVTVSRLAITGVSLQPMMGTASSEQNGVNFDLVMTTWRLFMPPGADVLGSDRIESGSLVLEVLGDPVPWPGVDGSPHHVEAMCKVYGGAT